MVAYKVSSTSNCADCNLEDLIDIQIKFGFINWNRKIEEDDHLDIRFGIEEFLTARYTVQEFSLETSSTPFEALTEVPKARHDTMEGIHIYSGIWRLETNEFVRITIQMSVNEEHDAGAIYENLENPMLF